MDPIESLYTTLVTSLDPGSYWPRESRVSLPCIEGPTRPLREGGCRAPLWLFPWIAGFLFRRGLGLLQRGLGLIYETGLELI